MAFMICAALALRLTSGAAQLPPGWIAVDVNSPGLAGGTLFEGGTWTVRGGGAGVCGENQFHMASRGFGGEATLITKLEKIEGGTRLSQAGLLFRQAEQNTGALVALVATSSNGITLLTRDSSGGCSFFTVQGMSLPVWLQLRYEKLTFAASYSTNGIDWLNVGEPLALSLGNTLRGGFLVTANDDSTACTALFSHFSSPSPTFGVSVETWNGLQASAGLGALTNAALNPKWPSEPDLISFSASFASTISSTNSGQRLRAYVVPPQTGDYTFWLTAAQEGELRLSDKEDGTALLKVASVPAATFPGEWTKYPSQQSTNLQLQAGRRYYLESVSVSGSGPGHAAVRWRLPNGSIEEPILANGLYGTLTIPITDATSSPGVFAFSGEISANDGRPATLVVLSTNQGPLSYQWLADGTNIPGVNGTESALTLPRVTAAMQGIDYVCILSNAAGAVTSPPSKLNVILDQTPPTLLFAQYLSPTNIQLQFSETLDEASATNILNYSVTNGLPVTHALLDRDSSTVILTTDPMTLGATYFISVQGVRDLASFPNTVPAGSEISVFAAPFTPEAIGDPSPPGSIAAAENGYSISGGGTDIGSGTDSFQLAYERRSGDFDIRVRVKSLSQTDLLAKAGLLAIEDLRPAARYAGVLATPSLGGAFFSVRTALGARAAINGNAPVNYPHMWLRLRRSGDEFTGFASYDGVLWQQLGTVLLSLPQTLYVGMAVTSRHATTLAKAEFRDWSDVTSAVVGNISVSNEPLGPSSRRTGLVISEIMYNPPARSDGRSLEFVEIFNTQAFFQDIGGYSLDGDISYRFPKGTQLAAGASIVVGSNPADLRSTYGLESVAGPYTNTLGNSSGTVRLRDKSGSVLLQVTYGTSAPWPVSTDGAGHSLILASPSYGEGDPRAWAASDVKGGSPGVLDGTAPEGLRHVVINELLANSEPPALDFVELFNTSLTPVDISGAYLTDNPASLKFQIPSGTLLPPRGYVHFDERTLGFRLDAAGETVYLVNPANSKVLDAVRFGPQERNVTLGRVPDGGVRWAPLSTITGGTTNTPTLVSPIVINEILYDPISGDDDQQFVELYNRSAIPVPLGGWRFVAGIDYTFPAGAVVQPGGFVVVTRNRTKMLSNYPGVQASSIYGDFAGQLAGKGERVALAKPQFEVSTNGQGVAITNVLYVSVDDVNYQTGGRWSEWANEGGSSLELIDPEADNALAASWQASDESHKAPWTTIEFTGLLDHGSTTPDQLHVILQEAGETLLDNVEVFPAVQNSRLANGSFSSGAGGWAFQGTHRASLIEQGAGPDGSAALRIRASGRGDTGANRIRAGFTSPLQPGTEATIRANARWLKGNPEILLRLRGNWLEAAARLNTPANPGTPGARNSRALPNAGPAIHAVTHSPTLPAAGQPVIVTARIQDPQEVSGVTLFFRNDTGSGPVQTTVMTDDGAGADAVALDGVFSGAIPGHAARTVVAFYIEANDAHTSPATSRFPEDAPTRECLVGFGESLPAGTFGVYRMWLTRANVQYWSSREKNSNDPIDATFVYGNSRVVYNMRTLYSGSPFHTGSYSSPVGSACDYVLRFPDDDRLLGAGDFVIATLGNLNNDSTAQREQGAFHLLRELGVPSLHRRYIHMFINGTKRGTVMEDTQQPGGDLVEQYFPDDPDGHLYKIEDWFEFDNSGSSFSHTDATLEDFTTTGGAKKVARYRWNWRPRAVKTSAHDFTNLFHLVDSVWAPRPEPHTSLVNSLIDVDGWMHTLAVERMVGNWDSWGYQRGKNMYAYKPQRGRWQLMAWDIDFVFDLGHGPTSGLFYGQDPALNNLLSFPPFARAYWRALYNAAHGPLQPTNINPVLDAKYAALIANNINASAPGSIKTYINSRRSSILSQLAGVSAQFTANFTVANNVAQLSGTAPVNAKTLLFNGNEYPVTWNTVTTWSSAVPLAPGPNPITITALDSMGEVIPGLTRTITPTFSGTEPSPDGTVVINEIMYDPALPGAEYIELFNNSPVYTFDLSGWELNGLSYAFAQGAVLRPNSYLVLAADRTAFMNAYGSAATVFDTFDGTLQDGGERLSLNRPGRLKSVAQVRYEPLQPWPANANGTGSSLQLVDPRQDNWRVANWAVAQTNEPVHTQWVRVTITGSAPSSRLYIYLLTAGELYLDDISLVEGIQPEVGVNLLANGGFETPLAGQWQATANFARSTVTTAVKRSGDSSLLLVASAGGSGNNNSLYQNITPSPILGQTYTLSFYYLQSPANPPLTVRLSGNGFSTGPVDTSIPGGGSIVQLATPGRQNSVSRPLASFPPVWINEVQPENISGIADRFGNRSGWVELFNPTTNAVSLSKVYLGSSSTNRGAWAFPAGAVLNPGQMRIIFTDGKPELTTATEWHAGLVLPRGSGAVFVSRSPAPSEFETLDYVRYNAIGRDRSFGSIPDGQSFDRAEFVFVTPGTSNNVALPQIAVRINEWMADNTGTISDPADNDFEDWFELYNTGPTAVDLGGYYLTDNLTNKFQFQIPATGQYRIPPSGFLVVWADNEPSQNNTNQADLHVNFRLDKGGESLGLFGPDGTPVDTVVFGPQQRDTAEGLYPDGTGTATRLGDPSPGSSNLAIPVKPPRLGSVSIQDGHVVVSFVAVAGLRYQLQHSTDLSPGSWQNVGNAVAGEGNSISMTHISAPGQASGFYRVVVVR